MEKYDVDYKNGNRSNRIRWFKIFLGLVFVFTFIMNNVFLVPKTVHAYSWDTVTTFEFRDKDAAQLVKKYEELSKDDDIHLVALEEKKHLNGKTEYKQTTKRGDFAYLGYLKNGQPNGFGIIFKYTNYYDSAYVPRFIGNFSKGYLDGYGIWFAFDGSYYCPSREVHYKKGELNGQYYEYMADLLCVLDDRYDISDAMNYAKQDEKFGKVVFNYPFLKTVSESEGKMKNGNRDGDWTINGFKSDDKRSTYVYAEVKYSNNGKKAKGKLYYQDGMVKYDGEMNGDLRMDGKGTLYREDGSIEHKGEFKKGDIKN